MQQATGGSRLSCSRGPRSNVQSVPHPQKLRCPGYLTIQLLITFAEVLLPFIFAMLVVIVLEPMKKFVLTVFSNLAVCRLAAGRALPSGAAMGVVVDPDVRSSDGPADGLLRRQHVDAWLWRHL